jgi:hypothetical protein
MGEVKQHCCQQMSEHVNQRCEQHPDAFDCPDKLIHHSAGTGEYGIIIHDGGSSYVVINYCPWCGARLPGDAA